jgi:oligoribonuclease
VYQRLNLDAISRKDLTKVSKDSIPDGFVVVDVETTGLDELNDVVLELGVVVTDRYLNILHENSWLIQEANWLGKLIDAVPVVREMHEKSGLKSELLALPEFRPRQDSQIADWGANTAAYLAWLWLTEDIGLEPNTYPMVGSSVLLDRSFAKRRLPIFDAFFTYRCVDVSSIKELCKVLNPSLYAVMKADPKFDSANKTHRVLDDCRATIAELEFYLTNWLGWDTRIK